jgi:sugar phosphate isomerase/epimerase
MKGPAIFLAQFMGDTAPFNSLESICRWAADLGYVGVQIPTWDSRLIDLALAAESKTYCDELKGRVEACGVQITELSTHLQGLRRTTSKATRQAARNGPLKHSNKPPKPAGTSVSTRMSRSPAR